MSDPRPSQPASQDFTEWFRPGRRLPPADTGAHMITAGEARDLATSLGSDDAASFLVTAAGMWVGGRPSVRTSTTEVWAFKATPSRFPEWGQSSVMLPSSFWILAPEFTDWGASIFNKRIDGASGGLLVEASGVRFDANDIAARFVGRNKPIAQPDAPPDGKPDPEEKPEPGRRRSQKRWEPVIVAIANLARAGRLTMGSPNEILESSDLVRAVRETHCDLSDKTLRQFADDILPKLKD